MAFAPHLRITAVGRLGTPVAEQFSYGFCMAADTGLLSIGDFQGRTALAWTDLADSVRDFHARATTGIDATAVLELVKIAAIGADGKYLDDPQLRTYSTPGGIARNITILPQAALVVSLTTALRGPSGKGRFYIPMPSVSCDAADGYAIPQVFADNLRASAATLLNDVNNWPGSDTLADTWNVCVASSKGFNTRVTGVRVGRIVDTMRSRRNKLLERYNAPAAVS